MCAKIVLANDSFRSKQVFSGPRQINLSEMNKLPNTDQPDEHDSINIKINEVKKPAFTENQWW